MLFVCATWRLRHEQTRLRFKFKIHAHAGDAHWVTVHTTRYRLELSAVPDYNLIVQAHDAHIHIHQCSKDRTRN
jgi:hypothetical protein